MNLVPRQTLLVQLLHEGIGIELLDIVNARFLPKSLAEHHGTNHGWNASGVADALHARLLVSGTMATVVIYIIGMLLAVVANTTNATANRGLSLVILAQILWVGQYSFQELQRYNLYLSCACAVSQWSLILYLVDTAHANILNHLEVLEVLLAEGHPEAGTLDGWIVDDQRLNFLMVQQIAVTRTNLWISQILVNLQRLCLNPLAILPVESLLSNLTDVDLWVEIGGECLVVVASIAVNEAPNAPIEPPSAVLRAVPVGVSME